MTKAEIQEAIGAELKKQAQLKAEIEQLRAIDAIKEAIIKTQLQIIGNQK